MHTNIHRSTIYCSQDTEAPYMSTDRGVNKEDVAHVYSGLLLSYKKWNNAICSNRDGHRDYYTKWGKSDRERQIPYDTTYTWNLKKKKKKDTDKLIYKTEVEYRGKKQNYGYQGREREG